MKPLLSILVFSVAYVLIASEKVSKTIVAVLGGMAVILFKLVTFDQAISAIDLNVIFLLIGMMTSVHVLAKTGFFFFFSVGVAKYAKGEPWRIVLLLLTVTAVLSAFLDNVTTVILVAPISILIMQLLEVPATPVIILEAIASNVGGTATLIGDPPNIIIGSQANLSFNSFLVNLTPIVAIVFVAFIMTISLTHKKHFRVSEEIKQRVMKAIPHLAIVDKVNMIKSLCVFCLILLGFLTHEFLNLKPGIIALGGSMVMLLVCHSESEDTLAKVEWDVIFFFIGIFIMISALEVNGVISWLGQSVIQFAGKNLFLAAVVILWGSAFFAAVLNNIPFVIAMVPLVKHFVAYFAQNLAITDPAAVQLHIAQPLWWALALGACLGGNGTLIGASANIVSARIGARNGYDISFVKFFRYGSAFLIQSMILCTIYLWLRYF